jgi:adenine deaminase
MGAVKRTFRTREEIRTLMAVGRGEAPPELMVTGGQVLNVYSGELVPATVAVAAGRIAYVGERSIEPGPHTTVVEAAGRIVAPGYFDPHSHPYALFTPDELARAVLPLGTTAVVADTLLLMHITEPRTTLDMLDALGALPLRFYWFHPWLLDRIALGLAAGRRVEGHAPGASADRVQVLTASGFSSDHEAITAEQALARLRSGLYVMLRHGSLRPDLPALASVATAARAHSGRIMLTPDGPSPTFIQANGYLDYLLAVAMRHGVDPIAAYQMTTINPATYYALDEEHGGIAPGRRADLLLLRSLAEPRPSSWWRPAGSSPGTAA